VTPDDRRKQDRERLEEATRALMTTEGWVQWAKTRSRFHRYSFGNQLLIAQQAPNATRVAGYKTWQGLNRQVVKGEKGIRIFAPIGGLCRSCKGEDPECGRCGGTGRWQSFKVVSVFDVAQTDGEPLPGVPGEPVTGDSHAGHLPTLEALAQSQGLSVTYEEIRPGQGGYFQPATNRIVVSSELPPNGRVHVLIHELAHALGIGYEGYGHHAAEVIVETVAYIVANSVGLDVSSEALAYVASWGESDDLEALKSYAGTIDEIAGKLETALGVGFEASPLAA
jgi:hypothetical protein